MAPSRFPAFPIVELTLYGYSTYDVNKEQERAMTSATADRPTEALPAPGAAGMMAAIVQDEYGSAPEAVLRIAQVAEVAHAQLAVRVGEPV